MEKYKQLSIEERSVIQAQLTLGVKLDFPRIHRDLRETGVRCGVKRVARLMQQAKLKSTRGYRRPRYKSGKPAIASPNRLQQQFTMHQPDIA